MPNNDTPKTTTTKPRGRKTRIDPEIIKLRKQYAQQVKEYTQARASAAILKTILTKRLPRLTRADREKLLDALMTAATPRLVGVDLASGSDETARVTGLEAPVQ